MNAKKTEISYSFDDVEKIIAKIKTTKKGKSIQDFFELLPEKPTEKEEQDSVLLRIERTLESTLDFFKNSSQKYVRKAEFFNGGKFVVTPSELEIEAGILFPGHRFAPFCDSEIYPSEVELQVKGSTQNVGTVEFECDMLEVLPQHVLLGVDPLYDYVMAEKSENSAFLYGQHQAKVTLEVFDFEDFYNSNEFSSDDAILFTVKDYKSGIFEFSYLPESKRNEQQTSLWIEQLENALMQTDSDQLEDLDTAELLAYGFFIGGYDLLSSQAGSLDEFARLSDLVDTLIAGEELDVDSDNEDEDSENLPEQLSLSAGNVESVDAILKELKSPISPLFLDGFIFAAIAEGNSVDELYRQLFAETTNFTDDAQQAWFQIMIEERFEYLNDNFDRHNDAEIAEIRWNILEQVEQQLKLFEAFKAIDKAVPAQELKQLESLRSFYEKLLARISTASYKPSEDEKLPTLLDELEKRIEHQEMLVAELLGENE